MTDKEKNSFQPTHGLSTSQSNPADCKSRKVQIFFDESEGRYLVEFVTQWGDDVGPTKTSVMLTSVAAELLLGGLAEIFGDRPRFKFKADES